MAKYTPSDVASAAPADIGNACTRGGDAHVEKKVGRELEPVEDLECLVCAEDFTMMSSLNRHIKTVHTAVEGGVKCTKDFCEMVFQTRHEMYIHRTTCIFTCPVCSTIISKNGKAAGHIKKCNASRGIRDKI